MFDFSGTAWPNFPNREPDFAADIAILGRQLEEWFRSGSAEERRDALVRRMVSDRLEERPTAEEVAEYFGVAPTPPIPVVTGEFDLQATNWSGSVSKAEVKTVSETPFEPGSRLGRFIIQGLLGEGGMGSVYRADDPATGEPVAIKVLKASLSNSAQSRRRFVKEGRLLARVDTPFVTRVREANTEGETCYLALEYVPGDSLGKRLRAGEKFDEPTALDLMLDAARGVAVAHNMGIIHRDLKPDNLLSTSGSEGAGPGLKVADFGLARQVVQTASLEITRAGSMIGTPLYMPPEQFGAGEVDSRADVYSLGATLFHLLVGRPPFPETNLSALAKAVSQDVPPLIHRLNPDVGEPTAQLVARCLAKNPDDRPPDAEAFLKEMLRIRRGEETAAPIHPRATGSRQHGGLRRGGPECFQAPQFLVRLGY